MSDEKYPALGFDPARGNVATVRNLASQMSDTATYAGEAHEVLVSVQDKQDVWKGPASRAFADKLGDLPGYLDSAHSSLKKAGKALSTWGDQLEQHQKRAGELEEAAKKAIAEAEQADAAAQKANAEANTPVMHDGSPGAVQAAQSQVDEKAQAASAANRAAGAAWDRVDGIRRQAQQLMETWNQDGAACAEQLNRAAELAPDKGFFESIGDALAGAGDWVMDHLGEIGDVAGMISAVAGALSFIPVLAPFTGPIALAAGGVALAAHGGEMVKEGKWDEPSAWVGLGADMLGVLPGVGAAAKGGGLTVDLMQGLNVSDSVAGGARLAMDTMQEVPKASTAAAWAGDKVSGLVGGNADTIAKSLEGTLNVAFQTPSTIEAFAGEGSTGALKDGSGYAAAATAANTSLREWETTGNSIKGLGSSLSSFTRALG